jgi:hypothetical protein
LEPNLPKEKPSAKQTKHFQNFAPVNTLAERTMLNRSRKAEGITEEEK